MLNTCTCINLSVIAWVKISKHFDILAKVYLVHLKVEHCQTLCVVPYGSISKVRTAEMFLWEHVSVPLGTPRHSSGHTGTVRGNATGFPNRTFHLEHAGMHCSMNVPGDRSRWAHRKPKVAGSHSQTLNRLVLIIHTCKSVKNLGLTTCV